MRISALGDWQGARRKIRPPSWPGRPLGTRAPSKEKFHGDTPLRHFPGRILPLRWQKLTLDVDGNSRKNGLVQKCCVPVVPPLFKEKATESVLKTPNSHAAMGLAYNGTPRRSVIRVDSGRARAEVRRAWKSLGHIYHPSHVHAIA